jgi:hypothetical protein
MRSGPAIAATVTQTRVRVSIVSSEDFYILRRSSSAPFYFAYAYVKYLDLALTPFQLL